MSTRRPLFLLFCSVAFGAPLASVRAQAPEAVGVPYKTEFAVTASPDLAARVPARLRAAGVITVATNPNTPPTVFVMEDNRTLAGREIDVMSAVAHRLGLEPRWVNAGSFANIVPSLVSGRYDAALANLSVTPERLKQVDFVSYFNSNRLALVKAGTGTSTGAQAAPAPATDILALCGETIGAGSGTMNAEALRQQAEPCKAAGKEPVTIPLFPSRPAGVQAVVSGRVPGFFGPYEGLRYTATASGGKLYLAGVYEVPADYVGIGLQKDSPLTPVIADALNSLIADGTYAAIMHKWELDFGALPQARQNGAILNATPAKASGG